MAYSKQAFTLNQVLTAAECNQIEDNISDHTHSEGGVALVKIGCSANDTTPNYLENKIVGGTGISVSTLNDAGDEDIQITATAVATDELSKVTSDDTTAGYLFDKIVGGSGITATETGGGGDEDLTLSITAGAITQSKLATALQQNSASLSAGNFVELTYTGGQYNLMAGIGADVYGQSTGGDTDGMDILPHLDGAYGNGITIANQQTSASDSYYFQSRYITASPPYDLGDGEIPLFIFVMIDNASGDIIGVDIAADPPWANNGPTDIRTQRIEEGTGKKFKTVKTSSVTVADVKAGRATIQEMLASSTVEEEIEITAAFKNSDMNLFPHPWGNTDMAGKTVALMDPLDDSAMMKLIDLYDAEDDVTELFIGNYLRAGTAITRPGPNGISQVRFVK